MKPKFRLRFPEKDLGRWAAGYSYPGESEIAPMRTLDRALWQYSNERQGAVR